MDKIRLTNGYNIKDVFDRFELDHAGVTRTMPEIRAVIQDLDLRYEEAGRILVARDWAFGLSDNVEAEISTDGT